MTRALSGRPADCFTHGTARLGVPVPEVLLDLYAPWVEREEEALAEREAAAPRRRRRVEGLFSAGAVACTNLLPDMGGPRNV